MPENTSYQEDKPEEKNQPEELEESPYSQEELEEEPSEEEETSEKPEQDISKLTAQRAYWRRKSEKAEKRIQELEKAREEKKEELKEEEKPKATLTDQEWKEKIEFVTSHRDLDKAEVDEIFAYAKGKGISLEDAFNSDFIKLALEASKEKGRKEEQIPEPSSRSTIEKKEDFSKMPEEEKRKKWPEMVNEFLRARRTSSESFK
ncbi:MAG: hypothetical protein AB1414_01120 [bacterium]